MKQPGWVLLGDGCPHNVVPVLGRACTPSQQLRTTGWSCWMQRLAEWALGLIRYVKERHLGLFERGALPISVHHPGQLLLRMVRWPLVWDVVNPGSLGSDLLKMSNRDACFWVLLQTEPVGLQRDVRPQKRSLCKLSCSRGRDNANSVMHMHVSA